MAKLTRKQFIRFARDAILADVDKFGSVAAGSLVHSLDPDVIQALSKWTDGWPAAVMGNKAPILQDINAVDFVFAYMLACIFEEGIPDYEANTTYYAGAFVNVSGILYVCIATTTGHAPPNTTYWAPYASTVDLTWNAAVTYSINQMVTSAGALYVSLANANTNNAVSDTTKWRLFSYYKAFTASTTWVCPPGLFHVTVLGVAGGGGGGGGANSTNQYGGGGGGGGNFGTIDIPVTPGTTYTITIGAGGAPGTSHTTGSNGGDTIFLASGTVLAGWKGGNGGGGAVNSTSAGPGGAAQGNGGAGGAGSGTLNTVGVDGNLGVLYRGVVGVGGEAGAGHCGGGGGGASYGAGGKGQGGGAEAGSNGATNGGGGGGGAWASSTGGELFYSGGSGYMEITS